MKNITQLKKGSVLEITFVQTKENKDSDLLSRKLFVTIKHDPMRHSAIKECFLADLSKQLFMADGKLAYACQIRFHVDAHDNLKRAELSCFGFTKARKRKVSIIGMGTSVANFEVKVKVRKEFFYFT